MMDKTVIEDEVVDASEQDMQSAVNIQDLTTVRKVQCGLALSENDTRAGKEVCKQMVSSILELKLPDTIRKRPELMQVIQLQQSFEEFTLQSMFAVVSQAVRLLNQLSNEDALYTAEGVLDTFKLQGVLNAQQHVMNVIAQFNMHVRRLPGVIVDMIRDIEYSQTLQIEEVGSKQTEETGTRTSKPLAIMLQEAAAAAMQSKNEHIEEAAIVQEPEPAIEDEASIVDDEATTIEL